MTTKRFKVSAVRTITSPANEEVTTYYTWVDFRDLPMDFSLDVNPRKPKMNTAVAKQLIKAVINDDTNFDINNRGIVITAKSFKFDTSTSSVSIDFDDDKSKYGILDGGHTYTAIIQNRDKLEKSIKKYVRLEILVGKNLDVSALADARNTSLQVSDIALFELDDKFEFIKDAIAKEAYADKIAYKDNDDKPIQVIELIKLMFAFNLKKYPDDTSAPVAAYSGKSIVFKDYKAEFNQENNIYIKLAPTLPSLVELYEIIEKELPEKYRKFKLESGSKGGKFGLVRGIESGNFNTEFTNKPISHQISMGFLLPIFGAFRALLEINSANNNIEWRFDPVIVWTKVGVRLVQNTFDTDTNPQQVGKTKTLWQSNYRIVDGIKKDLLLEELLSKQS